MGLGSPVVREDIIALGGWTKHGITVIRMQLQGEVGDQVQRVGLYFA